MLHPETLVGLFAFWRVFVHRRLSKRLSAAAAGEKKHSLLSPVVVGLGIFLGFPTVGAYQDMTSLVSGLEAQARWGTYIE